MELKERDLVQWQPDTVAEDVISDAGLEDLEYSDRRDGWDFDEMIKLHEQKHGSYSTFEDSMSSYMSPYEAINDEMRAQMADKTAREIQMEATKMYSVPEDLISEEGSKSEDDLKSDDGSKSSEYPKSSDDDLKSDVDLKSEDDLKSDEVCEVIFVSLLFMNLNHILLKEV